MLLVDDYGYDDIRGQTDEATITLNNGTKIEKTLKVRIKVLYSPKS